MPIGKLLGVTSTGKTPYITETNNNNFVKNTFNFGSANPNMPESRNFNPYAGNIKGENLYCLA